MAVQATSISIQMIHHHRCERPSKWRFKQLKKDGEEPAPQL